VNKKTLYCHKCDNAREHAGVNYAEGLPYWAAPLESVANIVNPGDLFGKRIWMCTSCTHLRTKIEKCLGKSASRASKCLYARDTR
jgi:hypothetical protein